MGPFGKDNHEELVNQIKEHLAKMPEEQRKHLAQIALKIIGTNDPEKLKKLLQTQSSQLDLNKENINQAFDKFLKENQQ